MKAGLRFGCGPAALASCAARIGRLDSSPGRRLLVSETPIGCCKRLAWAPMGSTTNQAVGGSESSLTTSGLGQPSSPAAKILTMVLQCLDLRSLSFLLIRSFGPTVRSFRARPYLKSLHPLVWRSASFRMIVPTQIPVLGGQCWSKAHNIKFETDNATRCSSTWRYADPPGRRSWGPAK